MASVLGLAWFAACSPGGAASQPEVTVGTPPPVESAPMTTPSTGDCPRFEGEPFTPGPSAQTVVLQEGGPGRIGVEAVVYPRPDYQGKPWSQWGQGLLTADGRLFSAIGDHLGEDGNSYLYEFNVETGRLTQVTDVLSLVEHRPGEWGYGKVHGQMVSGPCGEIYFSTYWGKKPDLASHPEYPGDVLFRIDPQQRVVENLGTPVAQHGVPSLAGWSPSGLLYGEAVDPSAGEDKNGPFFAYDVREQSVVFLSDPSLPHAGFRNVAVGGDGKAFFSAGNGELTVFDPVTGGVADHSALLPGDLLRASTVPDGQGTIYGVTRGVSRQPFELFALEASGEVRTLGDAGGYTASMALHPDGSRFFFVPDAHGASWREGTPLVSVDTKTGEQQVVIELNELAESSLGLRLGGTYNLVLSGDGHTLYIGMNAGSVTGESRSAAFGEVVLVIVHLP
jgi:hypothetical protein